MSKSLYDSLEEVLTCPISLEPFQSPVKPDCCDHVFEQGKLHQWMNKQEDNNREETFHFNCPTCRKRIHSFAADAITNKLLTLYHSKQAEQLKKHFPAKSIDNQSELVTYLVTHGFADAPFLKILQTQHFFLNNPLPREPADQWLLKNLKLYNTRRSTEANGVDPKKHRRSTFGYSCYTKTTSSTELQQLIKTRNPKHFHTLRRQYWLPITTGTIFRDIFQLYIAMRDIRPHFLEHPANAWARITREELKQSKTARSLTLN